MTTRTVHLSLPLNRPATGAPLITGTATVGQELAVDVTGIEDEDGLHDIEYTYQWVRVDADGTSNEGDITDATAATYTLTDDDLGKKVKIEVSFPDDFGSDEQRTSAPTETVVAAATAPTVSTVAVTSSPASGDTYGTGEMIRFTVTFDQDVTVTGTPEFEFCLGSTATVSCSVGTPPPALRSAALSSGSGMTTLVFSYTVVAGDMDTDGIWIGNHDRTIKLDTGDAIRGTGGGLDAVLTHAQEGTQPGHKVNGEATDRAALVALYNATSGPNWTINTNWLTTAALSEWYGVTTDVDGRVTHVYLAQNELNGELPVELGDLTNLQILYLNQNMLSGAIPVALGKLTNLEQLSLSQNMLSGEIPAELGDLTNLRQLYLNQNMLSGEIPAELGDLTRLQILYLNQNGLSPGGAGGTWPEMLYLAQNELSGEIPAKLGDLASLQILYLAQNELSGEIPAALGDLASLEQLDISQNGLSGEIPAELGDLSSLQILYLWGNELSGEIPAALGDLASLQILDISQNGLSGAIPAKLGDLASLQILYLTQNELSGAIPATLGDLASLEQLDLAQNELSGAIPAKLGDLSSLQILYLWGNELSGAIPAALGDLASLEQLDISQNELSGAIPAKLGDLTNLRQLYLSQNMLSGELPAKLGDLDQPPDPVSQRQHGLDGAAPANPVGAVTTLGVEYTGDHVVCAGGYRISGVAGDDQFPGGRLRHPPPAAAATTSSPAAASTTSATSPSAGEQFPDGGCRPGPDRRQGRRTGDAGRQRQQRPGRRSAAISLESTQWPERGAVVPKRGQSHLHGPAGADGGCSAELQAAGHRSERSIRFRYGDDHRGAG